VPGPHVSTGRADQAAEIARLRQQLAGADPCAGFRDALGATIALLWPYGKPPRVPHFLASELPQAVEWLLDQRLTLMAALDKAEQETKRADEARREQAKAAVDVAAKYSQLSADVERLATAWCGTVRADLHGAVRRAEIREGAR